MDSDLPLIHAMARGDESALKDLMSRHKDSLHRFAFRYTGNVLDASEVTQETFVRAWFNARNFKPRAKASTWLFSICANLCRDRARRQRRWRFFSLGNANENEQTEPNLQLASAAPGPTEQTQLREEIERAAGAVENLPDKLKAPFILCVLEEHSHEEAAAILGVSSKTVETRIYRARLRLREQLGIQ